jgi:hypothetical protein
MTLSIPAGAVRAFRAALRRLAGPRARRIREPFVRVRAGPEGLALESSLDEAAQCLWVEGAAQPAALAFLAGVLDRWAAAVSAVELTPIGPAVAQARWQEPDGLKEGEINTVTPESLPPFPAPARLAPLGAEGLRALVEAARTAALDTSRLGLTRMQLRGKRGQAVGTDGKQLYLHGGLTLPWEEDVLVAAAPLVACRELAQAGEAAIGRGDSHITLRAGPWELALAIDRDCRFPDVDGVLPAERALPTRLRLAPEDVSMLLATLPRMPGKDEHNAPITLDLAGKVAAVRAQAEGDGAVAEALLRGSEVSGPPFRLALNRRYLLRALQLGFTEVRAGKPGTPLVCADERRTHLWMTLEGGAVAPAARPLRVGAVPSAMPVAPQGKEGAVPDTPQPSSCRNNGGPPNGADSGRGDGPPSLAELVAEAEELRGTLQGVAVRLGRLVAALKGQRRQARVVEAAAASLRHLRPLAP